MRTSTRRSSISCAFALALVASLAAPARADEKEVESYRGAVARGADHFQDGDYAAARRAFQLAYAIHPEPVLLFNIASTHRRQGNRPLALRYYRRFLEEAPDSDSRRALALKTIAELEAELAAPPPEPPRPAPTPPPRQRPLARLPRVEQHRGRALRWTGVAFGIAGAGGLGLAWLSARDARAAERSLEGLPSDQAWDAEQAATWADGRAANRRALVYGIAGGALAATGVVLFAVGHHQGGEVSLAPTASGGAVVMNGRF